MSKNIATVLILCFSQVDVSGSFFELDAPCLVGQCEASLASSLSRVLDAFAVGSAAPLRCSWGSAEGCVQRY